MGSRLTTLSLLFHFLLLMCTYEIGAGVKLGTEWKEDTSNYQVTMQDRVDDNGNEVPKGSELNQDTKIAIEDDSHMEISHLRLRSMDNHGKDELNDMVHEHAHGHMSRMDSLSKVFIIEKDLKVGYTMPISFPNRDASSSAQFLSREEADSIPFSSAQIPYLLQLFSFSNGSPQAEAMRDTLRQCELQPIRGETKLCATSLESMLEFTSNIFGLGTQSKVLTTTQVRKSKSEFQNTILRNYTILDVPIEISAPKMVACHTMPYPYAILYCHYQESKSKVFMVPLIGEYGEEVEAVVVCHMDTSAWDDDHISFRVLKIKPGTEPVCHFFPEDNLVWVPSPSSV